MQIYKVTDPEFRPYGRVMDELDTAEILEELRHTPLPADSVIYVASDSELEALPSAAGIQKVLYGELPVQIGYCNGYNKKLNALEYHRSSEINIAENDLILLLGRQQDIGEDLHYDTARVEAFLLPAGCAVEVYATTLHYAPCCYEDKPFRCLVVLPRGTNTDLAGEHAGRGEDGLLTAVNKWLIAHAEAGIPGAFVGLDGENVTVD